MSLLLVPTEHMFSLWFELKLTEARVVTRVETQTGHPQHTRLRRRKPEVSVVSPARLRSGLLTAVAAVASQPTGPE